MYKVPYPIHKKALEIVLENDVVKEICGFNVKKEGLFVSLHNAKLLTAPREANYSFTVKGNKGIIF